MPMKIVTGVNVDGTMTLDKFVPTTSSEFTKEEEKEVHKDKKGHEHSVQWSRQEHV